MCHEQWWAERRRRRAEESQEIWGEFDRTPPAEDPEDKPDTIRLAADDEPVATRK